MWLEENSHKIIGKTQGEGKGNAAQNIARTIYKPSIVLKVEY